MRNPGVYGALAGVLRDLNAIKNEQHVELYVSVCNFSDKIKLKEGSEETST